MYRYNVKYMVLTQIKKIYAGLLEFFWCATAYTLYKQIEYIFKKFQNFLFLCFLVVGGYAKPSFGFWFWFWFWLVQVQSTFFQFLVITPQRLQYAFQEPQNLVLNSFSCPHQDATLTGQEPSSVITQKSVINYKPAKKSKIRYIRYNKKSVISRFSQIDCQSTRCVPVSSRP